MSRDNHEAFETFEFDLPPIRGFPELRWAGKRPFKFTHYYPAQKKESYGDPKDGWWNRIYWGDNLQVMSHLLREFRGNIDLIYLDPPFDSKADYKIHIDLNGVNATNDHNAFEEKQYNDIWSSDLYLQFMLERLTLCRELLSENGSIYLHCDYHHSHHLRSILDEVFGNENFQNDIQWCYNVGGKGQTRWARKHDTIFFYSRTQKWYFDGKAVGIQRDTGAKSSGGIMGMDENGRPYQDKLVKATGKYYRYYLDEPKIPEDWWTDVNTIQSGSSERTDYPTQKPEELLRRIVVASCPPGGVVFDPFMGSGTTQAAAMKAGRKFIGADINLGAIETTISRLVGDAKNLQVGVNDLFEQAEVEAPEQYFTGIQIYNVNNYDLFRNPVEAKELIREAMELQPLPTGSTFDGQRDGYLVKIMPVNRIATRQDLNEVINGLDYKAFERRQSEAPTKPVERIHLVCMGHEPDLGPELVKAVKPFDIEVLITDLIRDKAHLQFKKSSDARLAFENRDLVIEGFYPMNLLQKLSLEPGAVDDWRQLVESVKVDFNYDGAVLTPAIVDAPGKNELVAGRYPIPPDAGTIRVKITDLISESWEGEIVNG
jgi:DNA modification methylase